MTRSIALLWLVLVLCAGCSLLLRLHQGLTFRTDLMALLPQDQQNPEAQKANDKALGALSRHVVLLIGDKDRVQAHAAASAIAQRLASSSEIDLATNAFDKDKLREIGSLYFPYRAGLLSAEDHKLLMEDKGQQVATSALARAYSIIGSANAEMLRRDPFMLMPDFFASLPVPTARLAMDDGMLSTVDKDTTWILISGQLRGDPFALATQGAFTHTLNEAVKTQSDIHPDLRVLHLGAVFFAKAGAEQAIHETFLIGIASIIGTILLVLAVFRAIGPMLLSMLAIGTGILAAFAGSLWIFGELHVGSLLFGTSLIGVAIDYSLQYCSEIFTTQKSSSRERLNRVFMAITLGASTTVIGYLTFLLAPFPGLHQIAVFSVIGIIGAWLTVVAWFPFLDRSIKPRHGQRMLATAAAFMAMWEMPQKRRAVYGILVATIICGLIGFSRLHFDDDVHHMQSLNPALADEQKQVTALLGKDENSQFILVQAPDNETALQTEEKLNERLQPLTQSAALTSFQTLAQFVPSIARQNENRNLVREHLYKPLLKNQIAQLHLTGAPILPNEHQPPLTPTILNSSHAFPFLSALDISGSDGTVTHLVMLEGVKDAGAITAAIRDVPNARFVDPAGDFSRLIGKYRERAIVLLGLSALLMVPLLIFRYGFTKGLWIMLPPSLAVLLAPALLSLTGASFTFFDAMALILILSIGVDYAIFCAETSETRKPVTMLAVGMAACTALLSFGLLALSDVAAVHHFGATMLVGILIAFLLSPMARLHKKKILTSFAGLILLFGLSGCASEYPPTVAIPPDTVTIAPDVTVRLPKVAELGRAIEAEQLVTAHYGDQTFVFQVRISADKNHFRMAALDMMGRRSIGIDWTDAGISYDTAPWVPPQLNPENILADMVLIYWPPANVRNALQGSGKLIAKPNSRIITKDGQKVFEVDHHPASGHDIWTGRLHYTNFARDYNLDVQSAIVAP